MPLAAAVVSWYVLSPSPCSHQVKSFPSLHGSRDQRLAVSVTSLQTRDRRPILRNARDEAAVSRMPAVGVLSWSGARGDAIGIVSASLPPGRRPLLCGQLWRSLDTGSAASCGSGLLKVQWSSAGSRVSPSAVHDYPAAAGDKQHRAVHDYPAAPGVKQRRAVHDSPAAPGVKQRRAVHDSPAAPGVKQRRAVHRSPAAAGVKQRRATAREQQRPKFAKW